MESIEQLLLTADSTESMLSADAPPFQIMVKTVRGQTITLNDIKSTMLIEELMQKLEKKDGIPISEQRMIYRGKELNKKKTVKSYSIERDSLIFSLLRLRGGLGERAAMEYTIGKEIHRGNLKNEITQTAGASSALKNWGRAKVRDPKFWEDIRRKLKMSPADFKAWKRENRTHVYAMIQETTHGGNCGDFSQVVHSQLVRSTKNQWVYQIVMHGPWPDKFQDTEPDGSLSSHNYDHQLCLTYPTEVSSLAAMDPVVATIADGWDNYKVCTLKSFIEGNNAYGHEMGWANLKIVKKELCTGEGPPPKVKSTVVELVSKDLDQYVNSKSFTRDKKKAMDKVDAGYNFGSRNAPIPDDVDDDRTTEDIARQFDQIGDDDWETFKSEALALADHQIWNYFALSKQARDNILKEYPVREKLYALFLEDNDSDFQWAMGHLDDDQFVAFFTWNTPAGQARDRILNLKRTRSRIFDIFNKTPNGLVSGLCDWIGEQYFVAYFRHDQAARDKILGAHSIYTLFYAVLDKQKSGSLKTLCGLMSDAQLKAYADSSEDRAAKIRKIESLSKRL